MDTNTKEIVASNLTAAYCANRTLDEREILEVYRRFLELLREPTSEFKQTPGRL